MPSGLKRYQTSGHDHFVTFTCYHRLPYLNDDHSKIFFEETLEKLRTRHGFYVLGYCLMPNHVHLLLSEPKAPKAGRHLPRVAHSPPNLGWPIHAQSHRA